MEQGRDGVERVEEKVRVKLHLEGLKLRLRELRFQLRGAQLAPTKSLIIVVSVGQKRHEQINAEALGIVADGKAQGGLKHVKAAKRAPDVKINNNVADDAGHEGEQC